MEHASTEPTGNFAPDPGEDRPHLLSLDITGGSEGERYEFHGAVTSAGNAVFRLRDDLRQLHAEAGEAEIGRSKLARLEKIDVASLAEAYRVQQPIPPCSVVGRYRLSAGGLIAQGHYMADPEQAATAGYRLHPAIAELQQLMFALAAPVLKVERPGPGLDRPDRNDKRNRTDKRQGD